MSKPPVTAKPERKPKPNPKPYYVLSLAWPLELIDPTTPLILSPNLSQPKPVWPLELIQPLSLQAQAYT